MSFIDEVRAKRQKLVDILSDEEYSGIRDIVEELYPDRAHFIYELLQNAEDRGATEVRFALSESSVSFEHDGQPFTNEDVLGITNIGKGTKREQEDQIGRFGIGFKAVFAYSETPHIWSPTFCFKITELVLPTEIPARSDLGQRTRFEFPFNNRKKTLNDAFAEVEAGLEELAETTLLFLSHLKSISWRIGQKQRGQISRIQHSENHIEVQKVTDGKTAISSHFLRFSKSVEGLEKQSLSVAFALELLPHVTAFEDQKALSEQVKIVPATPGRVAVFFPAEKETSGLRFHLHAPFVPELSRASIKDTPANEPLFKQLARLAAESLHGICGLKLLTGEFLGVLPNLQDTIPIRYQSIRSAIVKAMKEQPLTPTYSKSHAPAKYLLQAKASLKDLLSEKDIAFLLNSNTLPPPSAIAGRPQWAIGATKKNTRTDHFLSSLEIGTWDIDNFVGHLALNSLEGQRSDPQFMGWLAAKPSEWHQQMYLLFHRELNTDAAIKRLSSLNLVRVSDGSYSVGSKCYFPSDGIERDKRYPRVEKAVYLSGKNETDKEEARAFLWEIGVRDVGEPEKVRAILEQRYTASAFRPDFSDLKRFVTLFDLDKGHAKLFFEYFVIKTVEGWRKPSQTYLDSPVLETGLTAFYESSLNAEKRVPIAPLYADLGLPLETVRRFLEAIGVRTRLEVVQTTCPGNPEWLYLYNVPGERNTNPIDTDFYIPSLDKILLQPTVALSKLVWRTMCDLPRQPNCFEARYQKNKACGPHTADSQLVHVLRKCAWVPQGDGKFVRPAEGERRLLPEGFPFNADADWIKRVQFGEGNQQRAEQSKKTEAEARDMGFRDLESFERAKQFGELPQGEQERILREVQSRQNLELPEHESRNPERRAEQVGIQAAEAPERTTEQRTRSVSLGRERVKQEAEQYLREQYTNGDGEMFCQVCWGRPPLPFKLNDGNYYFEKVEFLVELKTRHYQNYLSLCPNHGAMFQYANGSRDELTAKFVGMYSQRLEVVLAQTDVTIYFTKTHIDDLKKVIEVDGKGRIEVDAA
jgi:hypothetical protein